MEDLYATSMTQYSLKNLKATTQSGRIHSVFKHTVNIIDDDGSFFTLANTLLRDGPNCLRVINFYPDTMDLKEGMRVSIQESSIRLKHEYAIHFADAAILSPDILSFPKPKDYPLLAEKVAAIQDAPWFRKIRVRLDALAFTKAVYQKIDSLIVDLENNTQKALEQLIGLGIGLTPSGDDFLTGFALVVFSDTYPLESLRPILKSMVDPMKLKTNAISQSQFHYALDGEARLEVIECLSALYSEEKYAAVESRIQAILRIGSSSGYDLLKGMLCAIHLSINY